MMIAASKSPSAVGAIRMSRTPGNAMNCCAAGSRLTTVTSLPSARSANAIASCDPIESPSGRECEEITKRRRERTAAVICWISGSVAAISVVVGGLAGVAGVSAAAFAVGRVNFVEQLLDAILSSHGIIVLEFELGHAFQTKARTDLPPQKRRRPIERARAALARVDVAKDGVENPGQLDVRADL